MHIHSYWQFNGLQTGRWHVGMNARVVLQYIPRNMHTVLLCFALLWFTMNSREVFIHIHQGCFTGTGAIVRLPQCQWSKPDGYGKITQCITTTKQKPSAYFLGYTVYLSAWLFAKINGTCISFHCTLCVLHTLLYKFTKYFTFKTLKQYYFTALNIALVTSQASGGFTGCVFHVIV